MQLEISNFAKIGYAKMEFDGITVIAGENNSGKTTVGKIIYSLFNSLYNIEEKVDESRVSEVHNLCSRYSRSITRNSYNTSTSEMRAIWRKNITRFSNAVCDAICSNYSDDFSKNELLHIIGTQADNYNLMLPSNFEDSIDELYHKILKVLGTNYSEIAGEMVYRFFDTVFTSQILSLKTDDNAIITLNSERQHIRIEFTKNQIGIKQYASVMQEAYFIDDPFVLDTLSTSLALDKYISPKDFLYDKLEDFDDFGNSIYDAIYAKDALSEIINIINDVVPGEISVKNDKWFLGSRYFDKPVDFNNLSAGLKSFVLLKMLLEKGIMKEKDILILDEPEIHLHPEWQLKYAEIIVLLQKMFKLNIIVTTHSRDFFEAIELYSKKHGVSDKCHYYLSNNADGACTFEDVTNDTVKIYRHLINPARLLDELRFELEDE